MSELLSPIDRIPLAVPLRRSPSWRGRHWPWMPSLVWLVPALVVLAGVWFGVRALVQQGPTVTVTFATAEGLEAHKTAIKYKSVVIGVVKNIEILEDRSGVLVTAELSRPAQAMLGEDARFWVVRPRVSTAGVSGIGTLLTGAHIGFDAGIPGTSRRNFVGLETPPASIGGRPGRRFTLRADNLGSLDVGSPVYLRRFQVGQITRVALDARGAAAVVDVFVDAPYDRHVTASTRFWNASGVDVTLDARGIRLDTQSLASVLLGGIAFETPAGAGGDDEPAAAASGSAFTLFDRAPRPAVEGGPEALPGAITRLIAKLNALPLDRFAREGTLTVRQMRRTLRETSRLVKRVDQDLAPELRALMSQTRQTLASTQQTLSGDAPLQQDLRRAMRDMGGAGQALRVLAEYLQQHPESLVFGKKGDRP